MAINYGQYGNIAIQVVNTYNTGDDIIELWNLAFSKGQSKERSASQKDCPLNIFIALCQMGAVKGIPSTVCPNKRNEKSKKQAKKLLDIMIDNPNLTASKAYGLYKKEDVTAPKEQSRNAHVVFALLKENLLSI
ncbi:DUF6979 family protein [Proteus mirabilis]|uniref:DUF6979 family protein n=1 Tax=Proteus mirabilis TaxID=584 RepID=UPI0034D77F14